MPQEILSGRPILSPEAQARLLAGRGLRLKRRIIELTALKTAATSLGIEYEDLVSGYADQISVLELALAAL